MNQVKEDEHYFADFTYGSFDAEHSWADPKEDEVSALYLDANFEKAFKIDDMSSVFHYGLISENGGLNSYMTGEKKSEIICSDGMLHEDDITSLPLAVSISHASEDHYLDVDFAKKVPDLDCEFCDELGCNELGVANLRSEIHSPGTSNDEVGVSESSALATQCFTDQSKNPTTDEMHDDSGSTCRYERPVEDKLGSNSLLTCDIHNILENSDDRNTVGTGSSFDHDGKKLHFSLTCVEAPCTSICTHDEFGQVSQCTEVQDFSVDDLSTDSCAGTNLVKARQRRLCRPPQRYLDGSQWVKSRFERAKKQSTSLLIDKDVGVRSQKKHYRKAHEIKASREQTNNLELDSDDEYEPDLSCFNTKKSKKKRHDRRKHSQPWTLDEVVALVDGMSQFGIGQWTAVKRSYFSSSHRTATDVRDKWRNLVKTNCKSSKGRKDDQHLRSGSQPLPKPVIERVRELAGAPVVRSRSNRG